ncbi:uncharacterized protein F5891DRAFT_1195210 [Suillus fuscotomentosus]|uniref:Uncharacterized protein n=1 Tax=Suillus fuscotomentosus TaxID=1912939 RepID=A0AAD4DVX9_9AGAM|nr:uncharacterized protein F5891DRAFT_1195210 [Suillus fuscotomentosus]KAG1894511.1 hypothetical protein F5891DRAFT_1195210 [Suillus fuscotomentosus]
MSLMGNLTAVTQAAVRLALSKTEAKEIERGEHMSLDDDVLPLVLISSGIELESQQCVYALFALTAESALPRQRVEFEGKSIRQHATNTQKAKILQHINTLRRRIDTWSRVQLLYMPCVSCLRSPDDITSEDKVHKIHLFLPSSLPSSFPCDVHLLRYEWDLRKAQENDALSELRTVINMTYHLYKYKDAFVLGQRILVLKVLSIRLKAESMQYRLSTLLPEMRLTKDAVPLKHDEGKTVSQQNISWIWKTAGVSNNQGEGLQDSLRVEWCKASARAHRWEEEVLLLREEMRNAR